MSANPTPVTALVGRTSTIVRGRKVAHTENHQNCTACFIALDSAIARRQDV